MLLGAKGIATNRAIGRYSVDDQSRFQQEPRRGPRWRNSSGTPPRRRAAQSGFAAVEYVYWYIRTVIYYDICIICIHISYLYI